MTLAHDLENVNLEWFFPEVWVGYAVNFRQNRRKLVKVWSRLPQPGNYRGEELLNLEDLVFYRPGSWRNSTSAPGCPKLSPDEYDEWYLVLVRYQPSLGV